MLPGAVALIVILTLGPGGSADALGLIMPPASLLQVDDVID